MSRFLEHKSANSVRKSEFIEVLSLYYCCPESRETWLLGTSYENFHRLIFPLRKRIYRSLDGDSWLLEG